MGVVDASVVALKRAVVAFTIEVALKRAVVTFTRVGLQRSASLMPVGVVARRCCLRGRRYLT